MTKGTAVFIDGASLSGMRYPLSIRNYAYPGLLKVLQTISTAPIHGKPLYVVPKDGDGPWTKTLRTLGFDVVVSPTKNGQDDRLIIQRISALKRDHVDEIIIVSTDQDYAPALKQKTNEGFLVHWVGTRKNDRDGTSPMGSALLGLCDTGVFSFTELAEHREAITREAMPVETPDNPRRSVTVTLKVSLLHSELERLLRRIGALLKLYPSAQFTLDNK